MKQKVERQQLRGSRPICASRMHSMAATTDFDASSQRLSGKFHLSEIILFEWM